MLAWPIMYCNALGFIPAFAIRVQKVCRMVCGVVTFGKKLYRPDDSMPELSQGFFFLLYNNRWGTNFKQWFEEDMRFAFDISFS